MSPEKSEILNYNTERLNHWEWLTMLGMPIWDVKEFFPDKSPRERQLKAFNELSNLIGQPSLDAWRYFLRVFASDFPGIAAVACVFYHYYREPKSTEFIKRESRILFPLEVAIDPNLLSWEWIDRQRENLAKKWKLSPVSFGITGNVYCQTEWDWIRSPLFDKGELGEYWIHDEIQASSRLLGRERVMVFGDVDEKTSDKQFLSASEQLGTPFLIADTKKGHHVLFPLLFGGRSFNLRDIEIEATSAIGLTLGVNFHTRYIFRSHRNYEYVLRVTPGLGREETPMISALVWDGNTIVRSSNKEELNF